MSDVPQVTEDSAPDFASDDTSDSEGNRGLRSFNPFRGWERKRLVVFVVRCLLIGVSTYIAIQVVQPSLVLTNTTPTGGDMGAHVWGPAYLRDHLLPWKLAGWSMDWYSGLPVYRFYMVLPALFILALDVLLPYAIAFKIIAVAGIVTLPLCCWLFGRLARFAYPLPEVFAVIGLVYIFDESYTIYGGNLASTMAGEFSFSISLSFAMLAFGLFANGLQTGRRRIPAAIFMALAVLSHGIVAIYVAVGLLIMAAFFIDRVRMRWFVTTVGLGSLLSAFWILPFLLNHAYMTDMKYKGEPGNGSFTSYWGMFFALPPFWNMFLLVFALIGFAAMIVKRNKIGMWLGATGVVFTIFVYLFNDSLPVIGLLWNPRLLPMLNMCRYLLAAIGVVEAVSALVRLAQWEKFRGHALEPGVPVEGSWISRKWESQQFTARTATASVGFVLVLIVLGFRFQTLPFGSVVDEGQGAEYSWGPFETKASNRGFVDGWARWNFSGYEGKRAYGEYFGIVQTMKSIGEERGCGRALWENFGGNDRYGTTMALMLLPFWTDGCIGSSEGLFFEASGTTPYHFLAAGAMSKQSSNPVRELRYVNNDASEGVRYLQELGISYYMAVTPEAVAKAESLAESDGSLTLIETSGPWHVYAVAGSDVVVPLSANPVVVNERGGDQRERWLEIGTSWLQNEDEWLALPAADGPDEWQRVDVEVDLTRRNGEPGSDSRKVDIVTAVDSVTNSAFEPAVVSDVELLDESVSFSVSEIGKPVLVRVSYFPNWNAEGAQGPYRVAPNMMVVVPTDTEVRLTFGPSTVDRFAYVLTFIGIVTTVVIWRRERVKRTPLTAESALEGSEETKL
ncbi:MAG: 6-pyruvoyl-tetrahydropterin synthase-related protein [Actinomycetota bacterium]